MRAFTDATGAIKEPKTARMEQRTKPHVKATIQQAAAALGVDETTFVTSVAYERAQATLIDHQSTVLSARDAAALMAALDTPARPSAALKKAAAAHKARVRHGA